MAFFPRIPQDAFDNWVRPSQRTIQFQKAVSKQNTVEGDGILWAWFLSEELPLNLFPYDSPLLLVFEDAAFWVVPNACDI